LFVLNHHEELLNSLPVRVGKYLISPLPRRLSNGEWAASVSIRSGRGSSTTDRVLRFTPRFESALAAVDYATGQALSWMGLPGAAVMAPGPAHV
jgi:hypothetical protein